MSVTRVFYRNPGGKAASLTFYVTPVPTCASSTRPPVYIIPMTLYDTRRTRCGVYPRPRAAVVIRPVPSFRGRSRWTRRDIHVPFNNQPTGSRCGHPAMRPAYAYGRWVPRSCRYPHGQEYTMYPCGSNDEAPFPRCARTDVLTLGEGFSTLTVVTAWSLIRP